MESTVASSQVCHFIQHVALNVIHGQPAIVLLNIVNTELEVSSQLNPLTPWVLFPQGIEDIRIPQQQSMGLEFCLVGFPRQEIVYHVAYLRSHASETYFIRLAQSSVYCQESKYWWRANCTSTSGIARIQIDQRKVLVKDQNDMWRIKWKESVGWTNRRTAVKAHQNYHLNIVAQYICAQATVCQLPTESRMYLIILHFQC